jgi:hypothetical protein
MQCCKCGGHADGDAYRFGDTPGGVAIVPATSTWKPFREGLPVDWRHVCGPGCLAEVVSEWALTRRAFRAAAGQNTIERDRAAVQSLVLDPALVDEQDD